MTNHQKNEELLPWIRMYWGQALFAGGKRPAEIADAIIADPAFELDVTTAFVLKAVKKYQRAIERSAY